MTTEQMLELIRQGHLFTNEEWLEIKKQEKQNETNKQNKS